MNVREYLATVGRNVACGYLSNQANVSNWAGSAISRLPGIGDYTPPLTSTYENLRNLACSLGPPPFDPPVLSPDVGIDPIGRSGGYCNVPYEMTVVWNYKDYPSGNPTNNPPTGSAVVQIVGPVGGFFTANYPSPNLLAVNGDGLPVVVNGIANDTLDYNRITSVSFSRIDGLPDNCQPGIPDLPSQPPVILPPLTPPIPTPRPFVIPIILPPVILINGEVQFNFEINLGEGAIQVGLNLNTGDISFNIGGNNGDCCSPGTEPVDPGEEIPGEPPPVPPETKVLAGIIVKTKIIGEIKATEIFSPTGASVFAPRLGLVSFSFSINGASAWSEDVDLKRLVQWVPVSGPFYASGWDIIPEGGVSVSVRPVYINGPKV